MAITEDKMRSTVSLISGSMIAAKGMTGVAMGELLRVGELGLIAEVVRIDGDTTYAQVFEETYEMYLGEPVVATGKPLTVELGPGLLGQTFDGIQRPLSLLHDASGAFIHRGTVVDAINRDRKWRFTPSVSVGDIVAAGDVLGTVPETDTLDHKIMVPQGARGKITSIVEAGEYTVTHTIATLDDCKEITMLQRCPVKQGRPILKKLPLEKPFLTGQRVLDCLFPIPLGGSAIVPGGFGTGKTVVEQTLSKYCNADIIIYVGCGERGNEMAEVLTEFPDLTDPKTGGPLINRTVLVVNTSNMPVAARDASVYTGIAIAEYYRDMGYSVALMADSTSRWAEALREMSSRLEEMPGEEGYPTYLSARISEFYERSGRVLCCGQGNRIGSLTLVSAVSPPGGDFSEPVTQISQRVAGALWALDASLAYRRHYPAINWNKSYSLYLAELEQWFEENGTNKWHLRRQQAVDIMQRDAELQEVVQLVGPDSLQDAERLTLEAAKLIRDIFLQQNAFSENDVFSSLEKTGGLLEAIILFHTKCRDMLDKGVTLRQLLKLSVREELAQLRDLPNENFTEAKHKVIDQLDLALSELAS